MKNWRHITLQGSSIVGVVVPETLFALYLPHVGAHAVGLWISLAWLSDSFLPEGQDVEDYLAHRCGLDRNELNELLARLIEFELVQVDSEGISVFPPISEEEFSDKFSGSSSTKPPMEEEIQFPDNPSEPVSDSEADMQAVLDIYHKRVGMMGPSQLDKLRFWVETKGISAEVVAMAIDEMLKNAKSPRIEYLEGILRNWYNDGIRTLEQLMEKHYSSSGSEGKPQTQQKKYEGVPNAGAYYENNDLIRKWRELYGDDA